MPYNAGQGPSGEDRSLTEPAFAGDRVPQDRDESLRGRKVTVVGLGRFGGGVGVTGWLCGKGAVVTVSDVAEEDKLRDSVRQVAGLGVTLHLGGHDEADFLGAGLLVVNPAVPKDMPLLKAAEAAGVPRTSEMNLFLQRCCARVVGVTGTVGKSTTTAMIGEVLCPHVTTHVGGNIGRSLLADLPRIQPDDVVVVELSSFQLEDLPLIGRSPNVALVTNLMPNHLDRHGTMDAYVDAKKNIFRFQSADDVLILNRHARELASWGDEAPGRVAHFDASPYEPFDLDVLGSHNQANAQAAWAAVRELGLSRAAAAEGLRRFTGLPHRLQLVANRAGVRYYNDSKCTTPEGAVMALTAFPPRTAVMIVGGHDKGADFAVLGATLGMIAKAVVALGDTSEKILSAVEAYRMGGTPAVERANDLSDAVGLASRHAAAGDAVVLSPACASYDMFANYEERGDRFTSLVRSGRS